MLIAAFLYVYWVRCQRDFQLIDLRYDGSEDDDRANVKVSSQKRFRALLMLTENIAAYVLECEDCKRHLNSAALADEMRYHFL